MLWCPITIVFYCGSPSNSFDCTWPMATSSTSTLPVYHMPLKNYSVCNNSCLKCQMIQSLIGLLLGVTSLSAGARWRLCSQLVVCLPQQTILNKPSSLFVPSPKSFHPLPCVFFGVFFNSFIGCFTPSFHALSHHPIPGGGGMAFHT